MGFLWWGNEKKKPNNYSVDTSKGLPFPLIDELETAKQKGEKIYLVLPGGGACGRFQIWGLYWLYQLGIFEYLTGVVGTSVGGINTALVAKYRNNFDAGTSVWNQITWNKDVFDGMLQFNNLFDIMGMVGQINNNNKGQSILNQKGLIEIVNKIFGNNKLSDFKDLDVVLTATDIDGQVLDVYTKESCDLPLSELVLRTSAIPLAFMPQKGKERGHKHVDGGFGNNDPVQTAVERGATKIIIIGTWPKDDSYTPVKDDLFSIAPRLLQMAMNIFEMKMWQWIDLYEKYANSNPNVKSVEFCTLYPPQNSGLKFDSLKFDNPEIGQCGYDTAIKYLTKEKLSKFLCD